MKPPSAKAKVKAFTLVELLVVIFIVAIFVALLLPAKTGRGSTSGIRCLYNQKQIALGVKLWQSDNHEKFPWEISSTNSGSMESANRGYAAGNFEVLSDYLKNPTVFVCPTDKARNIATNTTELKNQNLSYFVATKSCTNIINSILTGDRHLQSNDKPIESGLFIYSANSKMNWTHELHSKSQKSLGVLSFIDGHAEVVPDSNLNSVFQREGLASNRLYIP